MQKDAISPQYPIESVDNALKLILLLGDRPQIRLTEASAHLGVASSTAHRILAMLAWRGFVRQDPSTKAYLPGPALTTVAFSVLRQMDLTGLAEPILNYVSSVLRETSHLGVLEGNRLRFLAVSEPDTAVRVASRLGQVMPAFATSTGKALLAELSREQLHSLYPTEELEEFTTHSVRTRTELEAQLDQVRQRGYAVNREESEDGVGSVAVAVPTSSGLKIAINASAPIHRLPANKAKTFALTLHEAALRLAEILG
ncbi:IclR family transcriptional regulator [Cryobacterium serini]|uniref:IclR family transcriptional regulator n=1 Tax=Cryobacterium serini TaxID=1259201 RepID=A0A4R9BIQ9_9MICO|nr:IclR family transcriptional regulator [Cryobacterium serini]TFD85208.1 IclR family transcriptional regulator [Cryobacterium serini]